MKDLIPRKDQQDFLDVFWVLAISLEQKAAGIFDKNDVEQAFSLLNRIGFSDKRPYWEKE